MIERDITEDWPRISADTDAWRAFLLQLYGAAGMEMASFPYAALTRADGSRLGLVITYGLPRITQRSGRVILETSDLIAWPGDDDRSELREKLADYAHKAWSGWMEYLFRHGVHHTDGSFTIDAQSTMRWKRQLRTPYAELSEAEQASDRTEADQILALFAPEGAGECAI